MAAEANPRMSLARDVTTVGSATLASRLLGFARDVGIAAVLGAGAFADAFFAVLQIMNFFRRLLAEGALNTAFVPLWLRIKSTEGDRATDRFLWEVLAAMVLAVGTLALLGFLFAPAVIEMLAPGFSGERQTMAVDYLRIAAPYVALAGTVAVLAATLNAEGRFVAVALGVIAFNATLLVALGWAAAFGGAVPSTVGAILTHGIVLGGLAQLLITAAGFFMLRKTRPETRPMRAYLGLSADSRRFFARAVPALIAAGIPQLKLIAGAMVASSSPAALSWLYYANRLYELPLGVISIAIASVLMPAIAASVRSGKADELAAAQSRGFEIALGLALPAAVGFAVLAEPMARGLFERGAFGPGDTAAVAAALAAICAGLPGHGLEKVLGAISFAHEDTRTPMLAALAGLAAAVVGAFALFPRYGAVGVAAAIAISGWVGATLLTAILAHRGWLALDRGAWRRLPRLVVAAAVMGGVIFAANALAAPMLDGSQLIRIGGLVVLVALGLAVYVASLEVLGVARLHDLLTAIRQRV
jgi:putative peptidoglycan lipid II flippase